MIAGTDKELKLLDKTSAEFARKELALNREENDKFPFGHFFDVVLKKAYDLDFFHVILPENYGGIGHGMSALCIILSNICQEDSSPGGIMFAHTAAQETIIAAGAGELLKKTISEAKRVKDFLIAFPVFNNPAEIPHMADAVKKNDIYILSGSIEYLAIGGIAGHALIPAKIKGKNGYSFFLVDLSDPGIEKSDPVMSLGLHACPAVDIVLHEVEATFIGAENAGNTYFEQEKRFRDAKHIQALLGMAPMKKLRFFEDLWRKEKGAK
ncbi:MAG: acyl-CoA dehydrogenase family protein [Dissulfuribacterales bacterium]